MDKDIVILELASIALRYLKAYRIVQSDSIKEYEGENAKYALKELKTTCDRDYYRIDHLRSIALEVTDNERNTDHDAAEPTDHTAATSTAADAAAAAITAAATAAAKSAADAAASAAVAAAAAAAHFVRYDSTGAGEQA